LKEVHFFLLVSIATLSACREQHKAVPVVTTPDYKKGVSFLDRRNDSAYYYFNKVATSSKDSLLIGMAYNYMAVIQSDEGDYYGGQETLLTSLNYLHENNDKDQYCLVADYNLLGRISQNLKNYDGAIAYYDRALGLIKNSDYRAIALNNKAVAYERKREYARAIAIYESIMPRSKKSKKEYARVVTNLAMAKWRKDSAYPAAPDLLMALELRKAEKDDWGLNSSYAHLADYYLQSRPDSALHYARDMYSVASRLLSPDDELEALQKLIVLSPEKDLKRLFVQYQHLNDSLQTVRNAAKNQFALIRYDAEKNKADNLRLEQENTQKKIQIIQQRILIYGTGFLFLAVICSAILWYRGRQRHMEREKQNAIRENKLKTSQKVHDVVANGLYLMMAKIEHGDSMEKGALLDELEVLYEQSRDISYEDAEGRSDFQQTIAELLMSYAGSSTKVSIVGNQKEPWDMISGQVKKELKLILLELMTNMKKHSGARNVLVRFEQKGNQVKIRYTDDGIGFPLDLHYGNGLTSTENRIKGIGGQVIFDKNTPTGLKIEIYFPIG
jgi:signal transduction histidine kinase